MYANNKKLAERHFKKAKSLAEKRPDRAKFNKLDSAYKEIKEIWDKS